MNRKEWLKAFLRCVDIGADANDFRRYCRVKRQHLRRHMAKVQSYRDELARLEATETIVVAPIPMEVSVEESVNEERVESSTLGSQEVEEAEEAEDEERHPGGPTFTRHHEETMGSRDDTGDESELHD